MENNLLLVISTEGNNKTYSIKEVLETLIPLEFHEEFKLIAQHRSSASWRKINALNLILRKTGHNGQVTSINQESSRYLGASRCPTC